MQESTWNTYSVSRGWHGCWEDENDAHEQSPGTGPEIDKPTGLAHVPWATLELSKGELAEDGDAVTPVECNGTDIEYTRNSSVRSKTN